MASGADDDVWVLLFSLSLIFVLSPIVLVEERCRRSMKQFLRPLVATTILVPSADESIPNAFPGKSNVMAGDEG